MMILGWSLTKRGYFEDLKSILVGLTTIDAKIDAIFSYVRAYGEMERLLQLFLQ
jgi:hypothetical protein